MPGRAFEGIELRVVEMMLDAEPQTGFGAIESTSDFGQRGEK